MWSVVLQDQEENSEVPGEGIITSETSLLSSSRDNKRQALSVDIPVGPRLKIPEIQFQFLHQYLFIVY